MRLTVQIEVPEEDVDKALRDRIEELESEVTYLRKMNDEIQGKMIDLIKTQFPKFYFGQPRSKKLYDRLTTEKLTPEELEKYT